MAGTYELSGMNQCGIQHFPSLNSCILPSFLLCFQEGDLHAHVLLCGSQARQQPEAVPRCGKEVRTTRILCTIIEGENRRIDCRLSVQRSNFSQCSFTVLYSSLLLLLIFGFEQVVFFNTPIVLTQHC